MNKDGPADINDMEHDERTGDFYIPGTEVPPPDSIDDAHELVFSEDDTVNMRATKWQ